MVGSSGAIGSFDDAGAEGVGCDCGKGAEALCGSLCGKWSSAAAGIAEVEVVGSGMSRRCVVGCDELEVVRRGSGLGDLSRDISVSGVCAFIGKLGIGASGSGVVSAFGL